MSSIRLSLTRHSLTLLHVTQRLSVGCWNVVCCLLDCHSRDILAPYYSTGSTGTSRNVYLTLNLKTFSHPIRLQTARARHATALCRVSEFPMLSIRLSITRHSLTLSDFRQHGHVTQRLYVDCQKFICRLLDCQ